MPCMRQALCKAALHVGIDVSLPRFMCSWAVQLVLSWCSHAHVQDDLQLLLQAAALTGPRTAPPRPLHSPTFGLSGSWQLGPQLACVSTLNDLPLPGDQLSLCLAINFRTSLGVYISSIPPPCSAPLGTFSQIPVHSLTSTVHAQMPHAQLMTASADCCIGTQGRQEGAQCARLLADWVHASRWHCPSKTGVLSTRLHRLGGQQ